MVTFIICILILVLGYLFYSRFIERVEGADPDRTTPAFKLKDNVDYVPLPVWKVFLIQFLNIAGLGPIFGALAGAMWGPVAFLWIVFGAVFAGAVHDYFSGMLSIRHNGLSITEIVGIYLGKGIKQFMRLFTILLMILVGVVFIMGPAGILSGFTPGLLPVTFWVLIIFLYYTLATLMPVDKIIGRLYPVFGLALFIMAIGLITALFIKGYKIPELNRLIICIPLFVIAFFLTGIDFSIIWRYFAWANQTLAMIVLWAITVYLFQSKKIFWITLIPAVFMTTVTVSYLLFAPEGFSLPQNISILSGTGVAVVFLFLFIIMTRKVRTDAIHVND